ncbi:MAG: hypothetical protein ACOXZO_11700 [Bacteroidales bacterium]
MEIYYQILTGITEGHPSGVDHLLPRIKPGLLDDQPPGLGALLSLSSPGGTGTCLLIDINAGVDCLLPRIKPGLLDGQPSGLGALLSLSSFVAPGYWKTRGYIGIPDTGGVSLQ